MLCSGAVRSLHSCAWCVWNWPCSGPWAGCAFCCPRPWGVPPDCQALGSPLFSWVDCGGGVGTPWHQDDTLVKTQTRPTAPGAPTEGSHLLALGAIAARAALDSRVSPAPLQRIGMCVWGGSLVGGTPKPHTVSPQRTWVLGSGVSREPHPGCGSVLSQPRLQEMTRPGQLVSLGVQASCLGPSLDWLSNKSPSPLSDQASARGPFEGQPGTGTHPPCCRTPGDGRVGALCRTHRG